MYSGEEERGLSWEERFEISLDISHGIEYLHEGVRLNEIKADVLHS